MKLRTNKKQVCRHDWSGDGVGGENFKWAGEEQ